MSRFLQLKQAWLDAEAALDAAIDSGDRDAVAQAKTDAQTAFDRYERARKRAAAAERDDEREEVQS